MAAMTIGFFVSLVLLVFALLQREAALEQQHRAEEQARIAFSRELAAASSAQLATDPELSVILAIEGLERATTAEGRGGSSVGDPRGLPHSDRPARAPERGVVDRGQP